MFLNGQICSIKVYFYCFQFHIFDRPRSQTFSYLENYDNAMLASRRLNGTRWPDGSEIKITVEEKLTSSFLHAAESLFFSIS